MGALTLKILVPPRIGGGGAELLCCLSYVESAKLSCGEATSSQIVLSLRKSRKKPGMWPHLGKEAKERKDEPMQQSQARPSGAQSQHPAHTCTHVAGRPASSTLPPLPGLLPPPLRAAWTLAQDRDTSPHALKPTGAQPGTLPFILPRHVCVGSC